MLKRTCFIVASFLLAIGCASPAPKNAQGRPAEHDVSADGTMDGCHTPLGFIPEGHTANGYLMQFARGGQPCQQGTLSCEDGVWSGPYIYPSCVAAP